MQNRRMSGNDFGRKGSITGSIILGLIGMSLTIAAILTPSWQVVNLREYNSIHEHGLWLDCTRHSRDGERPLLQRYATISEPLHCVYKFDYDKYSGTFDLEDDNSPVGEVNRHKFYGWHTSTLILLFLAILSTFLATCLGICSCCYGSISVVYTCITLGTTIMSSLAVGIFFFYSHRADNRFIKGIVGTYEQRVGTAFFLQLAACFFYFFSFIVSMLGVYFSFQNGKDASMENYSINRSSRTNMTNVARSMEFDAPLFAPPQMSTPRQAYYKEDDRHVAESMPELGGRAFPSEIAPRGFDTSLSGRIRRKSETCV